MNDELRRDHEQFPALFIWNGHIDVSDLKNWMALEGINVPGELLDLWSWSGGGEMFESETILTPLLPESHADSVLGANAWYQGQGLSSNYLVFEDGSFLSAVRKSDGMIVELDRESLNEKHVFRSLEEWYRDLIKSEYGERYGLTSQRRS